MKSSPAGLLGYPVTPLRVNVYNPQHAHAPQLARDPRLASPIASRVALLELAPAWIGANWHADERSADASIYNLTGGAI